MISAHTPSDAVTAQPVYLADTVQSTQNFAPSTQAATGIPMAVTNRLTQPITSQPTTPPPTELPAHLQLTLPGGETIRHILLGSPESIRQTIRLLHNLRYVEISQWSPLIEIPENQLLITPAQGEVMSILVRRL